MELVNATRMLAGYTLGMEPSGRELLIVAVKGTFRIPTAWGARLALHEEQAPLIMSDVFHGAPGLSAPKYEIDFAPRKQRCDILLNGHAYAPDGHPVDRLNVHLSVGSWTKGFTVVGDRAWYTAAGIQSTPPTPFIQMPISYDHAFGGVDQHHADPAEHAAFTRNPCGRGFHKHADPQWLDGSPLPNTEEFGTAITRPDGAYRPMSFGSIARHWEPRYRYAGTYDQSWRDNVFPFLPADFDEQYYQAAPLDQQLPKPVDDQLVTLINLTPDGRREFVLPHFEAPVHVFPKRGAREDLRGTADTILIEPDLDRVTVVWRIARPLKKSLHEIAQVLVGRKGTAWWQQREEVAFPIPLLPEPRRSKDVTEAADG